ncbi:hypothetical protein PACTADRAFT_48271 [Pachysolen tannophilus NRRL Y-2460]|uniref:Uncharacterized protein n=1 Tax=Pachysolen tannophilus NRRL Y-2460 TaxID=669874 RepID=A0A1E4U3P2_PACTA|nr:hypothetical protein PACTADRAFT_48271 [Pachysolen tannophilus NRRL Y-2460]
MARPASASATASASASASANPSSFGNTGRIHSFHSHSHHHMPHIPLFKRSSSMINEHHNSDESLFAGNGLSDVLGSGTGSGSSRGSKGSSERAKQTAHHRTGGAGGRFFKNLKKSHTSVSPSGSQYPSSASTSDDEFKTIRFKNQSGSSVSIPSSESTPLSNTPIIGTDIQPQTPHNSRISTKIPSSVNVAASSSVELNNEVKKEQEVLFNLYKFFIKFQKNSKETDLLDYASFRLEAWSDFLLTILQAKKNSLIQEKITRNNELKFFKDQKSSDEGSLNSDYSNSTSVFNQDPELIQIPTIITSNSTAALTLTASNKEPNDLDSIPESFAGSDDKKTQNTQASSTATATSSLASAAQTNDNIDPDILRYYLVQLWHMQIWKKLFNSNSFVTRDILKKSKLSNDHGDHQICLLQKQVPYGDLSKNNEFSWLWSWQLAYDEKESVINTISLRHDEPSKVIVDRNNNAISDSRGQNLKSINAEFMNSKETHPFLSLLQTKLKGSNYLKNYSIFTTPSYANLPIKSNSQNILLSYDMFLSVKKHEWLQTLKDCHRVLKVGGYIQLYIMDIEVIYSNLNNKREHFEFTGSASNSPSENPGIKIYELLQKLAKKDNYEIRPSSKIMQWLKICGFKDIKYSIVCVPRVGTPLSKHDFSRCNSQNNENVDLKGQEPLNTNNTESTMAATTETPTSTPTAMVAAEQNSISAGFSTLDTVPSTSIHPDSNYNYSTPPSPAECSNNEQHASGLRKSSIFTDSTISDHNSLQSINQSLAESSNSSINLSNRNNSIPVTGFNSEENHTDNAESSTDSKVSDSKSHITKDERFDDLMGFCSSSVEYIIANSFIGLTPETKFSNHPVGNINNRNVLNKEKEKDSDEEILMNYLDYRINGDGTTTKHFDEGSWSFMMLTATK